MRICKLICGLSDLQGNCTIALFSNVRCRTTVWAMELEFDSSGAVVFKGLRSPFATTTNASDEFRTTFADELEGDI